MTEDDNIMHRLDMADKTRPNLPEGLMARVLADATAAQLALNPQPNVVAFAQPRPVMGWMASAAIAASALLGIALGYSGPDVLPNFSGIAEIVAGSSTTLPSGIDELGALDAFLAEG